MAKKEDLIADIILRITQGNPSDDLQIPESQIELWMDMVRSQLVIELLKNGELQMESFIVERNGLVIQKDEEKSKTPYYVEIPLPLSIGGDAGVYYVETEGGDEMHSIPPFMKSSINDLRFARLSRRRSGYFRVGKRLYLMGNSVNFYDNGKINVMIVPESSSDVDSEEEYPIDSKLLRVMMDEVEAIAKRELYGTVEDTANDGEQQKQQIKQA